ncbi:hypothetical protein Mnod_3872 [Methylobacterium nodulans ORS 2060]|uniref:Uncharacterized protein n=1 Tax=Methylobacterium nodulans (strain LMG 21967 / CNCM I-2342 / ORS 2060) TaxID=460265 RepID=B8ISD2_METNO|nr:hypothetical protein Mnod_3872 [Methylobacterium nodulans ORS 2060]
MTCAKCPYTLHAPETDEGIVAWSVIQRCGGQVRVGFGGVYALDFGAILLMADAMGATSPLLADLLPRVEPLIVKAYRKEGGDGE